MMKITMELTRKTRGDWVRTVNRIRHQRHMDGKPQPRVEVVTRKNGRKIGTVEY